MGQWIMWIFTRLPKLSRSPDNLYCPPCMKMMFTCVGELCFQKAALCFRLDIYCYMYMSMYIYIYIYIVYKSYVKHARILHKSYINHVYIYIHVCTYVYTLWVTDLKRKSTGPFPNGPMGTGQHLRAWCACNCWVGIQIPSGELTFCYGKWPCLMGKSTMSMAIFHCYVSSPEGTPNQKSRSHCLGGCGGFTDCVKTRPAAWAYCMFQGSWPAECGQSESHVFPWPKWLGPDHPTFWKKKQLEQQLS